MNRCCPIFLLTSRAEVLSVSVLVKNDPVVNSFP